jgi:hypothetical protein
MNQFEEPIKNYILKDINHDGTKYTYDVRNNAEVYAPYDGIIYTNNAIPVYVSSGCSNSLGVLHKFKSEQSLSVFCGVVTTLSNNDMVVKGQLIGYAAPISSHNANQKITWKILDTYGKKKVIDKFFTDEKSEKSNNSLSKKNDVTTTTTTIRDDSKYNLPGENKLGDLPMRLALSPFDYLQDTILKTIGARKDKKSITSSYEYDENKKQLIEEIERIKSLLK